MSVINTNTISLNSQRNLSTNSASLATTIQRLSSGLRINSAKDDAAGLAISERFSTQIRGLNQASRNANDGISMAQTAEGALGEVSNNLQRIRELAVQSRNATNSSDDRAALQKEVSQLKAEIDRVANDTSFNGTKLLDGSFTAKQFQIGANQGQTIQIDAVADANVNALGSWTEMATVNGSAVLGTGAAGPSGGNIITNSYHTTSDYTNSVSFEVDGNLVTLSGNFATQDDVAASMASQLGAAYTVDFDSSRGFKIEKVAPGPSSAAPVVTNYNGDADGNGTSKGSSLFDNPAVSSAGSNGTAGTFSALTTGQFTVNGKSIEVGAAADGATRASDLANAINAAGAGVSASVQNGALTLETTTSDSIVVGGSAGAPLMLAQTGLAAGTTNGVAKTGFAALDISSTAGADSAIRAMDAALKAVNGARADLGAVQNRFSSVIANLNTTSENLAASRSRIRDTDYAKETAELTRTQILQQAGTAMLAQANQAPQQVLSLLR